MNLTLELDEDIPETKKVLLVDQEKVKFHTFLLMYIAGIDLFLCKYIHSKRFWRKQFTFTWISN